ncbi:MAG: hypothetical protein A3A43_01700 [Candidatus Liptonbacteria bacterium RIFCSPLOWO2_01_FULL_56_20]|uniref:Glutamyl-tRNA amidotransferase n=1 Tax=Candidatus Liptonbacteria bacterium RIFCSPLOWO2_01_FULL_56_20 TaxID=1798652 RepID=A0A1G2CK60_9BACT|nr:MAG: hypothetical protein UY96_C0001G0023 [Parcubacteria group bacterium GW2011_GWB1_56_8]OGY97661.1 MAG: hypothetical protein A2681_03040 [Candidatus Liptonbacteria bacterium RIFCSPHIGHO2_01_FULL_56_18b]OGZ01602.1 MAG: hypothetical protein A3A43_01700 [Candidatus Liptonbacteria bacterium RIFCSPLOWO2_01_FULL_56_20]
MTLHEKIIDAAKDAQKAGDEGRLATLRLLLSELHNREIEKRTKGEPPALTDDDARAVFQKEAKKREEAIALFEKGGRQDLAEKEKKELDRIREYLPPPMSRGEIEAVVRGLKDEGLSDFQSLIKEAMKRLKGRASGQLVSDVVKEALR